ncbi:hypothetical protein ARALYDRAFT_909243 [Arabidopsis lyrata subsp. lyrata]|uniref:MPN domain-containing protein n=1 Tax=Arabidopsis lyrata subsp. lyrata TaxID=81972 RepID=D7M547_ARALL|nr:hypothetical protein ARALYDRAFT_909243 [Arabidopsis lyrata subsp. lyrata]
MADHQPKRLIQPRDDDRAGTQKLVTIEEHHVAQGLSIVGYFHANERFDDVELCGVAKNIGDLISRYFPQAPILLVIKCLIFYCYLL